MNRTDLRRRISARTGVSKRRASQYVETVLDRIGQQLVRGGTVRIPGLGRLLTARDRSGKLTVRLRPARSRRYDETSTLLLGGAMDQKGQQDDREGPDREHFGLDIGTSRIVLARGGGPHARTETQLNAFISVPYSKFTESILKQNRVSYHLNGGRELIIIGNESEKFANFFNTDSRRPMRNGVLNPTEENGLLVIHSIIEKLVPRTRRGEILCFSVPGASKEVSTDLVYHEAMLKSFLSDLGYRAKAVNEGLAVVFAELESENFTGIGISCGGGMCNVCMAFMSVPVLMFSTNRAGDFIDRSVASVTGEHETRVRSIKEEGLNLSRSAQNKYENALSIYYDEMILSLVEALRTDLAHVGNIPKIERPIPIVLSGGTATPRGFVDRFRQALDRAELPIRVSDVRLATDPLTATARGCAIAAMHEE
jgi:nucleoid DNA-binding protein